MASAKQIRELLTGALTATELTDTGLVLLNPQTSASLGDRTWTLIFARSSNSGKLRDRDYVRHRHDAQVLLSHKVKPKDQGVTLDEALDDADKAIRAVMTNPTLRAQARVEYRTTERRLSPAGDFIYSLLTFDLETDDDLY